MASVLQRLPMKIEVDVDDVNKYKADDRGRITIGSKYAGENVTVAVVEVEDE